MCYADQREDEARFNFETLRSICAHTQPHKVKLRRKRENERK